MAFATAGLALDTVRMSGSRGERAMEKESIVQTPWDCRWTRLATVSGRTGRWQDKPGDAVWVCVRQGGRRYVSDEECESCEAWEANGSDD
jgi:hypothetical protein